MQEDLSCMRHFELYKIPMYGFLVCVGGEGCFNTFSLLSFKFDSDCILLSFKLIVHQNEKRKSMQSFLWQTLGQLSHL